MSINLSSAKIGIQGPAGTVASSTAIESSPAASGLTTTDTVLVVQSGALVKATIDQVRGGSAAARSATGGTYFQIFDDFTSMNTTNTTSNTVLEGTGALLTLSGAGAQASQKALTEFIPGVVGIETGTTSTGYSALSINGHSLLFFAVNPMKFTVRFKIPVLSTVGEQFEVRMGIAGVVAVPANGFYLRAQHGDTNFEAVNVVASTPTVADTGVAINTSYHVYQVEWNGTTCYHRLDNVLVATQAAHPADITGLTTGIGIYKAAGTTSRSVYVDWWHYNVAAGDRLISTVL